MFLRLSSLCLSALLICCVLAPGTSFASSPARATLESTVTRVLDILKSPDYRDTAKRDAERNKIEAEIRNIFDYEEFSARTVGANWPSFTADQKNRFTEAFAQLLRATYLEKIDGYNGERIAYTGELASTKGDKVEVQTAVTLKDGKTVPVAYRMLEKQGRWVVYDVIIEGVSLVKNYRSQFQDLLTKGTPDQLIERVRSKADEVRAKAAQ
ncbi:MlaC/ttg2D family ABC transporter substrate-binding protein [Nitratidesulfovibrio vulgaris]|uniref:Toluene tolerance family protein n=1 Tax=Nitratidesulfovibrio vulgaris (strain ATCC 29579 / DSM 644 / CCUG 34227 / NCIMB 8303 / VKM B-1760 / Hildenborough) TaxID=882 RepID=Q72CP0_NITV2|nr:ABC transporter substrate-binding protein [Nitratidesulfovibrio vulgaris]AAS95721.1 conserved hypothetical protein [Nitratidesulfovibrio vulgaris str. Hildenborough]ADP86306.1 toluene tolerance family protein [Nitratidesulfovibrio vulgaris RCH1]WCB47799.1 ABC transporter substrate-binding protein [Nitratidesulfovibrio vulgaris]HBW17215.1 ABC transporter substrate-binding protein [Desulfovibrio sp.]